MRVDKIFVTHLRALRGDIKLCQSHIDAEQKSPERMSYRDSKKRFKHFERTSITWKFIKQTSRKQTFANRNILNPT